MRNESPALAFTSADSQGRNKGEARICAIQELRPDSSSGMIGEAKELLLEYGRFVQSQAGVASFCFGALKKEAEDLPESYLSQGGGALLAGFYERGDSNEDHAELKPASDYGEVIQREIHWAGFIAWRSLPSPHLKKAREVKRLWVRPEARGLRMGRLLVQALIDRAIADGKTELLLDTAPSAMDCAHRLYDAMGFVECPPYYGVATEGIVYMRKLL